MTMTETEIDSGAEPEPDSGRPSLWRIPIIAVMLAFAAFWVWALFFASKEAVNKIEDRAWAARAEEICAAAETERVALAVDEKFDPDDPALLARHADLIDEATDIVERMLDDVVSVEPSDEKGLEIVPLWEDDYRTFIGNRRDYTARLREGDTDPFTETAVDGIPISEKVAQFAGDNEMASCAPPHEQGM